MVTELGDSVDLIRLLQMSWEDRLRVSCHWSLFVVCWPLSSASVLSSAADPDLADRFQVFMEKITCHSRINMINIGRFRLD